MNYYMNFDVNERGLENFVLTTKKDISSNVLIISNYYK